MSKPNPFEHIRRYFCTNTPALPIAGLPTPKPCPFCGHTDVGLDMETDEGLTTVQVECGHCGAVAGFCKQDHGNPALSTSYAVIKEAARLWNERTSHKKR